MKSIAILLLLFGSTGFCQIQFDQKIPVGPGPQYLNFFAPVQSGELAFADVDGDLDLDVLVVGNDQNAFFNRGIHLYINQGSGLYTIGDVSNLVAVNLSAVAFADVDGDLDMDVLISGNEVSGDASTKLYLNDGTGLFNVQPATTFEDVDQGEIEFNDVDSDGDVDVFISGLNNSSQVIGKLYLNDGFGNYTEDVVNTFNGSWSGEVEFVDLDGDLDDDLFIAGNIMSSVYFNDGLGNFSLDLTSTIDSMYHCDAQFYDLDADSDLDLIISGFVQGGILKAQRYNNDGAGNFSFDTVSTLNGLYWPNISIFDFNDDSFVDVLITGRNSSALEVAEYYQNDGLDSLYAQVGMPFQAMMSGSTKFIDLDSDGDKDFIQSGQELGGLFCNVYDNAGGGIWNEVGNSVFEGVKYSSVDFADIDGDNDLDAFISGMNAENVPYSQLYQNDGLGNYTLLTGSTIEPVYYSSCKFGDVDNDGDNDLMVTGAPDGGNDFTRLYKNNGSGVFTIDFSTPFNQIATGTIDLFDMDGDNDLDIVLTGDYGTSNIFNLLINDGTGVFTLAPYNSFLQGIYNGAVAIEDVDGDNDLDIFAASGAYSRLYINDGSGDFSYSGANMFNNNGATAVDFADVDLDGDPDLCLAGTSGSIPYTDIFLNDGNGNFTVQTGTSFSGANQATVNFSDVDLDGDPDLLVTGQEYLNYTFQSDLYLNDGLGNFNAFETDFPEITEGDCEFVDIDNDGDQDLLITGSSLEGPVAALYENNSCFNYISAIDTICFGEDFILGSGDTLFNMVGDTIISILISAACDTVQSQTIKIISIDTNVTQLFNDLNATEVNADFYTWFNCDSSNYDQIWSSSPNFSADYPGNYGLILNKGVCSDTISCVLIDTVDFYNDPSYWPMIGEVFPYPVTAPGVCDGFGYSFILGGVPPYSFDWHTQLNNEDQAVLDSLCNGIHSLKVTDVLGDTIQIDYFVTDTANFSNLNNTPPTAVDTVYINISDCFIDYSLPLDSAFISGMTYLSSDTIIGFDLYEVEVNYWQGGVSAIGIDTISIGTPGSVIIALSIYCTTKSQNQVLSALLVVYHPSVLNVSDEPISVLSLFPNPTRSNVYLKFNNEKIEKVSILNSHGQLVKEVDYKSEEIIKIDLSILSSGIYFVQVISNGESFLRKVIKE